MSYSIITDTSANLPARIAEEYNLKILPFSYYINGDEEPKECFDCEQFDGKNYYDMIRNGTRVSTSQVTPECYYEFMKPILDAGEDILFVGMSSGISSSFASAENAAERLKEDYPERKIRLVDTKGASLGEGFIAINAAKYRDKGCTLDECAGKTEQDVAGMCQVFTVDNLMHLRKTGRLSNASAIIGSVLNIKPLLKGNENGSIVAFGKVRGRRKSLEYIAECYDRLVVKAQEQIIGIAHADCIKDAETLVGLLKRNNPPKEILTVMYEPVTGSHVGPGALALFFFGDRGFRQSM